jgi:predicted DNA-binding protein (MmcQ/YjbR family)
MAAAKKPTNPDEVTLRDLGLSFPEVTEEFPWDHRALKVKGKAFVFMGTGKEGGAEHDDFFISCKLPHSASMALTLPEVKPTGYGLGRAGWVSARYRPGKAPVDMLCSWIQESYCAIAPKKLAALLEDGGEPKPATEPAKKKSAAKKTATRKRATKAAATKRATKRATKKRVSRTPATKTRSASKKAAVSRTKKA